MRMLIRNIPCFLLFTLLSSGSMAQTVTPSSVSINGNTLQAKLQVTTLIEVDLVVEFEKSVGLNADNINISATLSDVNASTITNKLSSTGFKVIPTFPVIISIIPKSNTGFAFARLASAAIYTN